MTVILISLLPPLLWSGVNFVDKYLLSGVYRATKNALILYSCGFSLLVLPSIILFSSESIRISTIAGLVLIVGGILLAISIHAYLYALERTDVTVVIALSLMTPLFGYVFSYFLLGETLTTPQLIACATILAAALLISRSGTKKRWHLDTRVLLFMAITTAAQAAQETLFKYWAMGEPTFGSALFWLHIGVLAYGFGLVFFVRGAMSEFLDSFHMNGFQIGVLNVVSETVSTIGYVIRNYAMLLAPVVIVMTLNSFQPLFTFALGLILSTLFPSYFKDASHKRSVVIQRSIAIAIMFCATIALNQEVF